MSRASLERPILRLLRSLPAVTLCLLAGLASGSVDAEANGARLFVNGVPVLELRTSVGEYGPPTRAALAAAALTAAPKPTPVVAKAVGSHWVLVAGATRVLEVSQLEAKAHKSTPQALAESWAGRLRRAIGLPPLLFEQESLVLPLGQKRTVRVLGSLGRVAQADPPARHVLSLQESPGLLTIKAVGIGEETISVRAHGSVARLHVAVRPVAAELPQTLGAEVTGAPAAGSAVRGAIAYAIRTHLQTLSSAEVRFDLPQVGALGPGKSIEVPVKVSVTAPNAMAADGLVKVRVRNVPQEDLRDAELWYCNSPEVIRYAQNLFASPLRLDAPARLLYHHVNGTTQGLFVRIQAINQTDVPARLLVLNGDAKPHRDPVRAGMEAADQYMRAWMTRTAEVLVVPPRSTVPISLRRLSPGETASGLASLRLMDGPDELLVRCDAWPPFPLDVRWQSALDSPTPWREVGANPINVFDTAPFEKSLHIFPNPNKQEQVSYEVGGRYGFVRIGQRPIARPDYGLNLDGNFGVLYDITAAVANPTKEPADVEVVFEASAGYSGGLFLVNGRLHRTPLLKPKQEARIAKLHMAPGSRRELKIMTVPLSGSSYPATLLLRPAQATLEALHERTER